MKKALCFVLLGISCVSCEETTKNPSTIYTVEFRNSDETILYQTEVQFNQSAIYLGEKPTKEAPDNSKYYFDFKGWSQSLNKIQSNLIVYPQFHMIDLTELNDGDYTYRKMYEVKDDSLLTVGYEIYKYNNLEFSGDVIAPSTYRNLPILRVGEACFMDCDMKSIKLPETIEVIDGYAFNSSEYLENVNIPDSVYVLGNAAFYITRSITNINLNNIGFIDVDNFHLCDNLSSFIVSNNNHQYNVKDGVLYTKDYKQLIKAPEAINDFEFSENTVSFASEALSRMNKIKEIIIPQNISKLGDLLFFESKIEKVIILGNVDVIKERTFHSCVNLKEIILPSTITKIENYAFYKCNNLEKIDLSDSVSFIGDFAFAYCFNIKTFKIPAALNHLGYGALDEQTSLEKFEIATNNKNYAVFDDCLYSKDFKKLIRVPQTKETITFASNVEIIGSGSFYKCQKIESLVLPNTLKTIEDFAFYFLNQVQILNVPDSVTEIGESAFETMEYLVEIHLPTGLTKISNNLFANCPTLQIVNIPLNITEIGAGAFYNCMNLPSLVLNNKIISVGKDCFSSCNNLNDIYYIGSEEEWKSIDGIIYSGLTDFTTIHYEYI